MTNRNNDESTLKLPRCLYRAWQRDETEAYASPTGQLGAGRRFLFRAASADARRPGSLPLRSQAVLRLAPVRNHCRLPAIDALFIG
jgi:hypothetical protein